MILEGYNQWKDRYCLRCRNYHCRARQSVKDGSFFADSHLSLHQQIQLLILFVGEVSQAESARVVQASYNSVSDFFNRCRQRYDEEILDEPIVFEDNGIYEIDEAQIRHVRVDGDLFLPIVWVAGILERETGMVNLYRVIHRNFQELLPPINNNIPMGSLIFSDELPTYNPLYGEGSLYLHHTVNHSAGEYAREDFIEGWGAVNVHINTMEGMWTNLRTKLKFATRRNLAYIDLILHESMYRKSGRNLFAPFKI